MADCGCRMQAQNDSERATLRIVLALNALMFVIELSMGMAAQSSGLIADSLDMLADACIYAISLYAVGKRQALQVRAARLSGFAQIILALMVATDILRRFVMGSEPLSLLMITTSAAALIVNVICLLRIARHRHQGIHMRASFIFSANDVLANAGVMFSGFLVWLLHSRYPDLVIGLVISILVLRGGLRILAEANNACTSTSCGLDIGDKED